MGHGIRLPRVASLDVRGSCNYLWHLHGVNWGHHFLNKTLQVIWRGQRRICGLRAQGLERDSCQLVSDGFGFICTRDPPKCPLNWYKYCLGTPRAWPLYNCWFSCFQLTRYLRLLYNCCWHWKRPIYQKGWSTCSIRCDLNLLTVRLHLDVLLSCGQLSKLYRNLGGRRYPCILRHPPRILLHDW